MATNGVAQPLAVPTPDELFRVSYNDFQRYPRNVLYRTCSDNPLNAYAKMLRKRAGDLFGPTDEVNLPMIELKADGSGWFKKQIQDDAELQTRLGDTQVLNTADGSTSWKFIKKDPKCRFFFISPNGHSREALKITPMMLKRLLSFHQVMPNILDFIAVFGIQDRPRNIQFSSFRDQDLISKPAAALNISSLDRSGQQYQMCYNLKSVQFDPDHQSWSVVQAAAHHQFDFQKGNALWIFTQGHWDMKDRVSAMTPGTWRPGDHGLNFGTKPDCLRSTFRIHLLFCEWSVENWNEYMASIEDQLEVLTDPALYKANDKWETNDLLEVQLIEETANKTMMHLESNIIVLEFLERFYADLNKNPDFPLKGDCHGDLQAFIRQIQETVNDVKLQTRRATLLVRIASYRKALILEHLQAQATSRSMELNESMFNFSAMAQKETIAMRVIAFVTLLYLPATFVSTFFSTDVIKYQGDNVHAPGWGGTFSQVAMLRWVQVALPLTFLTGVFGFWYYRREKGHRDQQMKKMKTEYIV